MSRERDTILDIVSTVGNVMANGLDTAKPETPMDAAMLDAAAILGNSMRLMVGKNPVFSPIQSKGVRWILDASFAFLQHSIVSAPDARIHEILALIITKLGEAGYAVSDSVGG